MTQPQLPKAESTAALLLGILVEIDDPEVWLQLRDLVMQMNEHSPVIRLAAEWLIEHNLVEKRMSGTGYVEYRIRDRATLAKLRAEDKIATKQRQLAYREEQARKAARK